MTDICTIFVLQILSIACDNASCNDIMIRELTKMLPDFSGVNRTQCFLHIVNLCAKSIMRQLTSRRRKETNLSTNVNVNYKILQGILTSKKSSIPSCKHGMPMQMNVVKMRMKPRGGLMRCLHCRKPNAINYMCKFSL